MRRRIGEFMPFSFLRFSGETGNGESGKFYFPYRTVIGELGKQGEYIYRRYILPVSPFPIGATGAVGGGYSLPASPFHRQGGAR